MVIPNSFEPSDRCKSSKSVRPVHQPKDVIFAIIALSLLGLHSIDLILWGFGGGGSFCVVLPLAMISVPIAVIYLIAVALGKHWKNFSPAKKRLRIGLFVILLSVSIFHILSPGGLLNFTLINLGMRLNVARTGGVDQLQSWAIEILQRAEDKVLADPNDNVFRQIDKDLFSKQVNIIYDFHVRIIHVPPNEKAVLIKVFGGGFSPHCGVIVGPPTLRLDNKSLYLSRWRDGVYGYREKQY